MAEAGEVRHRQCVACSQPVRTIDSICRHCGTPTFFRTAPPASKEKLDAYKQDDDDDPESGPEYDRMFPTRGWNWGPLVCNWQWLFAHNQPVWGSLMLFLHLPVYVLAAYMVFQGVLSVNDPFGRYAFLLDGVATYFWGTLVLSILGLPFLAQANQIAWRSGKYAKPHEIKDSQGDYIKNWAGCAVLVSLIAMPFIYKAKANVPNAPAVQVAAQVAPAPPPVQQYAYRPAPRPQNEYTVYDRDAIAAFMTEGMNSNAYYGAKKRLLAAGASGTRAAQYLEWVAKSGGSSLQERLPVAMTAVFRCGNFSDAQQIIRVLDFYDNKLSGSGVYAVALAAAQGRKYSDDLFALHLGAWGDINGTQHDSADALDSAIRRLAPR